MYEGLLESSNANRKALSLTMLCMNFIGDYVKQDLFDIEDEKSPGLDGYTSCFFKKAWSIIIGPAVIEAVLEFFFTKRDYLRKSMLLFFS